MENFVVSARKYRPITFDSVVGQGHITNTLKNAIKNNQLAQAFLFCGPRGVGKTTCARILAKTINCQSPSSNTEACGECEACLSFQKGTSFSVHELDAASNNSVDDMRSLIEQVRIPPQTGKYKIYIIDEVHMLSQSAFNAFLKTLEEPPSYAIFILATTEKHKIIPTILSRCQIFDFNRIKVEDMTKHLENIAQKENIKYEVDGLHLIAQKADGGLRDALSMFDQIVSFSGANITYQAVIDNLNVLDYDFYFKITDALLQQNVAEALLIFDEILNRGFDGSHFVVGLASHIRNLLITKDARTLKLLDTTENIKQKYVSQSTLSSNSFLVSGLNILNTCDINYRNSKNQRLQVELALIKIAHIQHVVHLQEGNFGANSTEEKKKSELAPVSSPIAQKQEDKNEVVAEQKVDYAESETISETPLQSEPDTRTVIKLSELQNQTTNNDSSKEDSNHGFIPIASNTIKIPKLDELDSFETQDSKTALPEEKLLKGEENKSFNEQELKEAWKELIQKAQKEDKINLVTALSRKEPSLVNKTTVQVDIENGIQEDLLRNERIEILNFLRQRFNNYNIQLEIIKTDIQVEHHPYTSTEKFNHILKKNAEVNNLIKAFNLDIDS